MKRALSLFGPLLTLALFGISTTVFGKDTQETTPGKIVISSPEDKNNLTTIATVSVPRPAGSVSTCRNGLPLSTEVSHQLLGIWNCLSISPDGSTIVLGEDTDDPEMPYKVNIWRMQDNEKVRSIDFPLHIPMEYSPDGSYIWGAGTEIIGIAGRARHGQHLVVIDPENGKWEAWQIGTYINGYVVSPSGKYFSTAYTDQRRTWRMGYLDISPIWDHEGVREHSDAAFSHTDKYLALVTAPKLQLLSKASNLALFNVHTGKEIRKFDSSGNVRATSQIAFSKDDSMVAVETKDAGIEIFGTETGSLITRLELREDMPKNSQSRTMSFSNDGTAILIHWHNLKGKSSSNNLIQVRSVKDGRTLGEYGAKIKVGVFGKNKPLTRAWDVIVHPVLGVVLVTITKDPSDEGRLLVTFQRHDYFSEIMGEP